MSEDTADHDAGDEGTRDAGSINRPDVSFPSITTPTKPKIHARPHRGIDVLPSSSFESGRFGRMFRHLPVFELSNIELLDPLAQKMVSEASGPPVDNPGIPSGYTYLGQFIDHDITFDPVSSLQRQNDPDALHNFRTPRYDLDSVYGRGPADQPYLYDGPRLRSGESSGKASTGPSAGPDLPRTLPRNNAEGEAINFDAKALIGDPRNDENLIVSQLHATMLRFHNAVVDHVERTTALRDDNLFKEAQRLVRWHYQWVVVHDYLPRIVGRAVVDDILGSKSYTVSTKTGAHEITIPSPRFVYYEPRSEPYIPVEFSVAAYRFGHSMIRGRYHINTFLSGIGAGPFDTFGEANPREENLRNLNGFRRLPDDWGFDWRLFFPMGELTESLQPSLAIDTVLAGPLEKLPEFLASNPPASLAARNLQRGVRLGLPSGLHVARAMGIEPLSEEDLDLGDVSEELRTHPPLWYYILREAKVVADGKTLGPVGGRIVAEVLVGLLAHDPLSFLNVQPAWRPTTPIARADEPFEMADLIRFAEAGSLAPA